MANQETLKLLIENETQIFTPFVFQGKTQAVKGKIVALNAKKKCTVWLSGSTDLIVVSVNDIYVCEENCKAKIRLAEVISIFSSYRIFFLIFQNHIVYLDPLILCFLLISRNFCCRIWANSHWKKVVGPNKCRKY